METEDERGMDSGRAAEGRHVRLKEMERERVRAGRPGRSVSVRRAA